MSRESKKLSVEDWEVLLPVRSVTLGRTVIEVRPLGLEDLIIFISRFKSIQSDGQTVLQFGESMLKEPKKFVDFIKTYCLDMVPDLVGLDGQDFMRLPPSSLVEILDAVVDVNTRGTSFLKNLNALTTRISNLNLDQVAQTVQSGQKKK